MVDPVQPHHRQHRRHRDLAFRRELLLELAEAEALARDALRGLFVEYYLACRARGGFWAFVHGSRWDPSLVALVREGLALFDLEEQLRLFERGAATVARLGPEGLRRLLEEGPPDAARPTGP